MSRELVGNPFASQRWTTVGSCTWVKDCLRLALFASAPLPAQFPHNRDWASWEPCRNCLFSWCAWRESNPRPSD